MLMPKKSDAKMPARQNSLLTGSRFFGIINILNFYTPTLIKEYPLEQDWRICPRIRVEKAV